MPFTKEDGYGLLNARITYNRGDFYGAVWGKNITDETYRRSVLALPGQAISFYAEPQTYGVTLGYNTDRCLILNRARVNCMLRLALRPGQDQAFSLGADLFNMITCGMNGAVRWAS